MSVYLTQKAAKKLRKFRVFFLLMLAFFAQRLAAQDLFNLTPEESKQKREDFVNAALAYRGTPYLYAGTTRDGMDCSGLITRAGLDGAGVALPRTASSLSQYAQRIEDSELEPGDLVFFNTTGGISHAGIYIGNGEFVHSASSGPRTGVIVSKLSESYWKRTYRFAGRIFPSAASATTLASASGASGSSASQAASSSSSSSSFSGASTASASGLSRGTSASISAPAQSQSTGRQYSPYGLRLELRGTALWDFDIEEYLIRGATASVTGQWRGRANFYPGVTAGLTWDTRHDTMSVPICLSVTARNGLALFVGAQIIFSSWGEGSREFLFPGIIGASWTSPYKELGPVKIAFYQSIECVFVRKEGVAGKTLSDEFRLATGVSFAIGK